MDMETIGIIHSPYRTKQDCPIQPVYATESMSRVEVFDMFAEGLQDIESFSHIFLFYPFDRSGPVQMIRPTFLDDHPHGIFASRHPSRPNQIGMSIVRLIRREANMLFIDGIDILDQTPLWDIKLYIPQFDAFPEAEAGWTKNLPWRPKPEKRE